jgi:hypothetical protein
MGVWGAGNFASDAALDYAHEVVDTMVQQITETSGMRTGRMPRRDEGK